MCASRATPSWLHAQGAKHYQLSTTPYRNSLFLDRELSVFQRDFFSLARLPPCFCCVFPCKGRGFPGLGVRTMSATTRKGNFSLSHCGHGLTCCILVNCTILPSPLVITTRGMSIFILTSFSIRRGYTIISTMGQGDVFFGQRGNAFGHGLVSTHRGRQRRAHSHGQWGSHSTN